jgi:hypothetical protein
MAGFTYLDLKTEPSFIEAHLYGATADRTIEGKDVTLGRIEIIREFYPLSDSAHLGSVISIEMGVTGSGSASILEALKHMQYIRPQERLPMARTIVLSTSTTLAAVYFILQGLISGNWLGIVGGLALLVTLAAGLKGST